MKKTKLFALAFAALALGACSNDDIVDQQGGSTVNPGEQGYVSVALNLPTQPSTRANDNFDQGTEAEYAVNNAALLVFSGASEDAAVFTGAYPLTLGGDNYVGGSGAWIPGKVKTQAGWIKSGNRWWYRHADGGYTKNGWEYINGQWYLFDNTGWMLTGWQKVGGTWYYMDASGAMAENPWVGNYYVDGSGAWVKTR